MVMLPGWTHGLPEALSAGLTEVVAGIDWNSSDAISRVLEDPSCGVAVAWHQGHIVAYVKGITAFDAPVATDSEEAVTAAVAGIARGIRECL